MCTLVSLKLYIKERHKFKLNKTPVVSFEAVTLDSACTSLASTSGGEMARAAPGAAKAQHHSADAAPSGIRLGIAVVQNGSVLC